MLKIDFTSNFQDEFNSFCFFIDENLKLSNNLMILDKKFDGLISKSFAIHDNFKGSFGQIKVFSATSKTEGITQIALIGLGKINELKEHKIETLGGIAQDVAKKFRTEHCFIDTATDLLFNQNIASAFLASGAILGNYSFNKYFTEKKAEDLPKLTNITILTGEIEPTEKTFAPLKAIAESIYFARDLITEPGNVLYPESYSNLISEELSNLGVEVEVLGEREMKKLGMNSLLGVGQGSINESKVVVMSYNGLDSGDEEEMKPVAFIGKGVTFDTGGISIKPSANMWDMKYDMAGSASVVGVIRALAARKAKVNAIGVVGLVENMPGGNAQRPGDVVKAMSGKTIEVLDTDAEGRLVLADILWYAQDKFKPKFMVDLATLTGAVTIALGNTYCGLFSNDDKLSSQLIDSGVLTGEEQWRLPLHSDYDKMIKSDIADLANISPTHRGLASSSIGGQFLKNFVNNIPWAHLDIAGVAWEKKGSATSPKGAVGYGIKLLNKLVQNYYEKH